MSSFFKNVLKWGFVVAVAVIIYGVLLELLNINIEWLAMMLGYISIVILPTGVFMGMYKLAKTQEFNFGRAILTGLTISLIAAVLVMGYRAGRDVIAGSFGDVEQMVNYHTTKMQEKGASAEAIAKREQDLRDKYEGSFRAYFTTLKWYMMLGSGYTLISYLILMFKVKRNEKITT